MRVACLSIGIAVTWLVSLLITLFLDIQPGVSIKLISMNYDSRQITEQEESENYDLHIDERQLENTEKQQVNPEIHQVSSYGQQINTEIQKENSEGNEVNPQTPSWKTSDAWKEYMKNFAGSQQFLGSTYCYGRSVEPPVPKNYDINGLPDKQSSLFWTEFIPTLFAADVMREFGVITNDTGDKKTFKLNLIALGVDIFYTKNPMETQRQIGRDFLCDNQRYNHIPGSEVLTYKDWLVQSGHTHSQRYLGREHCYSTFDYMPRTYSMSDPQQCKLAIDILKANKDNPQVNWIGKIAREIHNGKGIRLLHNETIPSILEGWYDGALCDTNKAKEKNYLIQEFIGNPFLIRGRKFDFRVFLAILSIDPFMVMVRDIYIKMSTDIYDRNAQDLYTMITNVEKGDTTPLDEIRWTTEEMERYLISTGQVQKGWLEDVIRPQLHKHAIHLALQLQETDKLLKHPGVFENFGLDFVMDTDFKLWLIEVIPSSGLNQFTLEIGKIIMRAVGDLLKMEMAIKEGLWEQFDKLAEDSVWDWVYDERKEGEAKFHGILEKECIV